MSIPIKNPNAEVRNATVLAGLKQIAGNDAAAEALFAVMSEDVKKSNYIAIRNMAIGQQLLGDATLVGKKISVRDVRIIGDTGILNAQVAADGTAEILDYDGDGKVNVKVTSTVKVHADEIKGLLS
jgi:hypothetical protein